MARNEIANVKQHCPDCLGLLKKFKDDGNIVYECKVCQKEYSEFQTLDIEEMYERKQADKRLKASFEKFNKQIN
jgi:DNA-directed RNA polymerase subunit M/transcription elongation factor TFIIS